MSRQKPKTSPRFRVGKVTIYEHHGAWWIYFREGGKSSRRKVSSNQTDAEQVAAQVNAQLVKQEPTLLSFTPISIPEIRKQFLEYHESVLHSSMNTVRRYSAATQHLENFSQVQNRVPMAHELSVDSFVGYLRTLEVTPNGHGNTAKRKLRMKGVQYILETCRSLYHFAVNRRQLPPYVGNPFSELPLDRLKIEDSKPIFVFTRETELAFFQNTSTWESAIHFTLAKTGLRIGELTHLLIEDLDLKDGWLHVRNKIDLGWRIKTGHERIVPLLPELVDRLKVVIDTRQSGPDFRSGTNRKKERSTSRRLIGTGQSVENSTDCVGPRIIPNRRVEVGCINLVGRRGSESRCNPNQLCANHGQYRSPRIHLPEIMAAFIRHNAPRRECRSLDSSASHGASANDLEWPLDDRKIHTQGRRR